MSLYHMRTQHTGGHQELRKGIIAAGLVQSCFETGIPIFKPMAYTCMPLNHQSVAN